jgi:hypothetical protein
VVGGGRDTLPTSIASGFSAILLVLALRFANIFPVLAFSRASVLLIFAAGFADVLVVLGVVLALTLRVRCQFAELPRAASPLLLEPPTECERVRAVADAATVVDTKNALTSWHSQTKAEADVNLKRVAHRRQWPPSLIRSSSFYRGSPPQLQRAARIEPETALHPAERKQSEILIVVPRGTAIEAGLRVEGRPQARKLRRLEWLVTNRRQIREQRCRNMPSVVRRSSGRTAAAANRLS